MKSTLSRSVVATAALLFSVPVLHAKAWTFVGMKVGGVVLQVSPTSHVQEKAAK